jgi:hypothetical protein
MKLKHNKKRNTAFLFEALVRELTRAAIRKDANASTVCKAILKEHFSVGTVLHSELKLYRALYETYNLSRPSAEKLLKEIRESYTKMTQKKSEEIFSEQSAVIKKINEDVSTSVFSNFVPQYKNLATVYQIFNGGLPPEKRILLEEVVCDSLSGAPPSAKEKKTHQVDNLVMKNFVKKFNDRYGGSLHEEQNTLLNNYVLSFSDNGLSLKAFLHEEIGRLRNAVNGGIQKEEISNDNDMTNKANQVIDMLNSFSKKKVDSAMLENVLKVQSLVREIEA